MVAGMTTLKKLADGRIYGLLEERNRRFVSTIMSHLGGSAVNIAGVASIYWIVFQRELPRAAHTISTDGIAHYNRMHAGILESGLYLPPSGYEVCFLSAAHTDEQLAEAATLLAKAIKEEAHAWA
jgi:glutamate-1-semialdehyde 2,1-aminomutase